MPAVGGHSAAAQADNANSDSTLDTQPAGFGSSEWVVTEGVVMPVRRVTLSMAASGVVAQVLVDEGTVVNAGQVILRLGDAHQQAAVAQSEAALASAQAALAALEAGAKAQEIAAARANVDAAKARLARLAEGARPAEIAAAEAALQAAQATSDRLYEGPDAYARIAAEANLANAEAALRQAQAAYDQVAGRADIGSLPQSLHLQQATNTYEAAQARYDALFAEPEPQVIANARAQVKQAQATLDRLRMGATDSEIGEAQAMVDYAQASLELLTAGPRAEELAAASAAVDQAAASLQQARASLADTELRAPFAGTVAVLYVKEGEQVGGGMPVVELADLTAWQIHTDDLSELDVVKVESGDRVQIAVDAIPDLKLDGTVVRIKARGEEKRGDITYTAIIQLDQPDPRLRWNMTAVVTIPAE
jgi:multidrug resistance efflux pump